MTPLKIASRAYVNFGGSGDTYEAFRDDDQRDADEAMRAALLALANQEARPGLISKFHWDAFRAVSRAIANEGKNDG